MAKESRTRGAIVSTSGLIGAGPLLISERRRGIGLQAGGLSASEKVPGSRLKWWWGVVLGWGGLFCFCEREVMDFGERRRDAKGRKKDPGGRGG